MRAARALVLAVTVTAGCGDRPAAPLAPCRIEETSCQRQTLRALEDMRGQLWDPWSTPPAVEVLTPDVFSARSAAWLARFGNSRSTTWSDSFHSLGVLADGTSINGAEHAWYDQNAGAVYWPSIFLVTVVNRTGTLDDVQATATLTHEYVHAAQDRELAAFNSDPVADNDMVRTAMVEGEAVVYGQLARLRMQGMDPAQFDWKPFFDDWLDNLRAGTAAAPSREAHVRFGLPYPTGGALFARAWQHGGATAMNRLFANPPHSFVELMRASTGRPAPATVVPRCMPARLPPTLFALARDRLGAALLYAFFTRFGSESEAWEAALTWQGDQLWLVSEGRGDKPMTFWLVQAPGLGDTAIGQVLRARTEPPVLESDRLIFWDTPNRELAQTLKGLACP